MDRSSCRVDVRKRAVGDCWGQLATAGGSWRLLGAVGDCWGQLAGASMTLDRILIHQTEGRRIPLDPAEIFCLEAEDYTRKEGDGWELRLEPPVNRIIPIGRTYEARLWNAFGEQGYSKLAPFSPFDAGESCSPASKGEKGRG